jgi:TPR repeat protein
VSSRHPLGDSAENLIRHGIGVSQSTAEALRCGGLAADKGNVIAMGSVGEAYYNGLEVPQNYEEAHFC